ncbi:amidoligase family protein [Marinibaculum pumilum]|uniref:Amidoligase family protein n=1 Tax=Marinibaculum pumilum TaxID=1766165 RepID=A0ABV7L3K3_9PROT
MTCIEGLPEALAFRDGRLRRIGVELEFGNLTVGEAAAIVQRQFGGQVAVTSPHLAWVTGAEAGDFDIRLDSRLAHAEAATGDDLLDLLQREAAEVAGDVLQVWTPCEISAPPMPLSALPMLDRLADALRAAGAHGSGARPHYAYALQLNVEVRSLEAAAVLRLLQAFLLMEDWLRRQCLRDLSRQLTLFVRPFPEAYRRQVLDPGYAPDWQQLIRDHLAANPTRNRDLDLLPLFAHVRPDLVDALVDDMKVSARPAWHYRLPDCRLDEPGWSIATEWRRWVAVERLAADDRRFARVRRAFLDWGGRVDPVEWQSWLAAQRSLEES